MKLTSANVEAYLRARGRIDPTERLAVHELTGGVSNVALHVTRADGSELVIKQARDKLDVAEPWFCSTERIWREVETLRLCESLTSSRIASSPLNTGTPLFLFEERSDCLYAMSAAHHSLVVWKGELLRGILRVEVAKSCGAILGRLHSATWHDSVVAQQFDDRQFFRELRVSPYYRQIGELHSDLRPEIERLIDSVWLERHSLVHGDFSPKNLLVSDRQLMLIDFEVGHYGDPAFDVGFFVSHLTLKAFHYTPKWRKYFELVEAFWSIYRTEMLQVCSDQEFDRLTARAILNSAGCALARLDGKSPVEYLTDSRIREKVRQFCRAVFFASPTSWQVVEALICRAIESDTSSPESDSQVFCKSHASHK
jgi:5-methylthioribose kinase